MRKIRQMGNKEIAKQIGWLWITLITFIIVLFIVIIIMMMENYNEDYKVDFEKSNCSKFDFEDKCDKTEEQLIEETNRRGWGSRSCSRTYLYKCEEFILREK